MLYKEIQGTRIPALGFGTFRLRGGDCLQAMAWALEAGFRHIDTAAVYGNEAEVGEALAQSGLPREEIFLTSKVWTEDLEPEGVRASAEKSLRLLRMDYLDLLLIHWPHPRVPLERTMEAFMALGEAGRIRRIGISNFPSTLMLKALDLAPVFCNQVEYHPLLGQEKILGIARERDVMVTAYAPLAQGRVFNQEVLREIGTRYGKGPGQVALRWLVEQPKVTAIPRSRSREHIRANLEIFDFELSPEDRQRIAALPKDRRVVNPKGLAPRWD